jgi:hypothetical protein
MSKFSYYKNPLVMPMLNAVWMSLFEKEHRKLVNRKRNSLVIFPKTSLQLNFFLHINICSDQMRERKDERGKIEREDKNENS